MSYPHDPLIWLKELFINAGMVANLQHSSNIMDYKMLLTKKI